MLKERSMILLLLCAFALMGSCDRRNSVNRSRTTASFSVDLTIVRDLSTGFNSVDISFKREGEPFSDAIIRIGNDTIPNAGGEYYYINAPQFNLPSGAREIFFESPDDNYSQSVFINIPGDFEIEEVSPRSNNNATEVYIAWSQASGATNYLLVVATENYAFDGTSPYFAIISAQNRSKRVPETTFEDDIGGIVNTVYYIYVIAFNEGFGRFNREGRDIPMPDNLPERSISDPSGLLRYGTVAPIDSIIVVP